MRNLCLGTVALAALVASPAHADFINFALFGPTGTAVGSPGSGTTSNGVPFTISDSGNAGFQELCEDKTRACGPAADTWAGEFYLDEVILFNDSASSPVTITFATPITSLTDLQAQAENGGPFTETLDAFNGTTLVASDSAAWDNGGGGPPGEGTIPKLSIDFAGGITSVTISTTNDDSGFALGGIGGVNNTIPEPSTWALTIIGLAGLGFARHGGSRRTAALGT
jgi:hypothetical protein